MIEEEKKRKKVIMRWHRLASIPVSNNILLKKYFVTWIN